MGKQKGKPKDLASSVPGNVPLPRQAILEQFGIQPLAMRAPASELSAMTSTENSAEAISLSPPGSTIPPRPGSIMTPTEKTDGTPRVEKILPPSGGLVGGLSPIGIEKQGVLSMSTPTPMGAAPVFREVKRPQVVTLDSIWDVIQGMSLLSQVTNSFTQ